MMMKISSLNENFIDALVKIIIDETFVGETWKKCGWIKLYIFSS